MRGNGDLGASGQKSDPAIRSDDVDILQLGITPLSVYIFTVI